LNAPSSRVTALPATEPSASFPVTWSGNDTGSGIQSYTIYVSDSGGPYKPWLTQTAQTTATFIGNIGHTYAFYSAAADAAGNIEPGKTTQDTTTTVTTSCATDRSSAFNITRGGFRVNHTTNQFTQTVTVQNTSGAAITGPVALALDSLSSNAVLTGGTGITACNAPLNSPFLNLTLGAGNSLPAGASTTATLTFNDPTQAAIAYSTRILVGSGVR
jgi:hypothetical protein